MPATHWLLALAVAFVWGTNFVVIKWGLADFPPFLFAALRFGLSAFPLVLFVARPRISWSKVAAFGLLIGATPFGLLFYAMSREDISPGLASLLIQLQVFFTIGMAMAGSGERPQLVQGVALALAAAGMGWIAKHHSAGNVTNLGLLLVLIAALSWAGANMVTRSAGRIDMLAFVAWSSVFAVPVLLGLSLAFEGPARIATSLRHAGPDAWAVVAWQSVGNTLFGFGAWSWLLARHPAATVTPAALLVPVFGMGASALLLGEALPAWKLGGAGLVMAGLVLNAFATAKA